VNFQAPSLPTSSSDKQIDVGLLILRMSALFLFATFGWKKLVGTTILVYTGRSLATSGLGPLIKAMGFPFPGLLAAYAVLNESIGALFIASGFCTRWAALFVTLSMAGALYTSLRLGEEPLRAFLYLVVFATLIIAGPGRYSIDHAQTRSARS
jgi:putative oxidoreductase